MTTLTRRRTIPGAKSIALTLVALTLNFCGANYLQTQDSTEAHRKVVSRVAPEYPSLARSVNIRGNVKVEALVSPNGTVKTAEVKGGHPLLVQSALNAVYKWKWEPGAKETRELVMIQFSPQ
ncbi:MAG TPA: energy transducer TonB [Candidatus Sulfotelmatobacter sp.]|jgi:TonB family protein